jgi:hypothetical protein
VVRAKWPTDEAHGHEKHDMTHLRNIEKKVLAHAKKQKQNKSALKISGLTQRVLKVSK